MGRAARIDGCELGDLPSEKEVDAHLRMDELGLPLPLPLGAVAEEGEMAKEGEKGVWGLAPGEEDWVEDVEGWCACPTGPGAGCGEAEVSMCGPE